MKLRKPGRWLLPLALALLIAPILVVAQRWGVRTAGVSDTAGNEISDGRVSIVGGFIAASNGTSLLGEARVSGKLALADYQRVYDEAEKLLTGAENFRTTKLQFPLKCTTLQECLQNYADLKNGPYYEFCADYGTINLSGSCNSGSVRSNLIRARELFGYLTTVVPTDLALTQGKARDLGRDGVLTSSRELANIHLIFGNEFMVDAIDYRFSGNDPRSQQIIEEEARQLEGAIIQFRLGANVLIQAFNNDYGGPEPTNIADFFTAREFELFATISERLITAISEVATRYRVLGDDKKALALYDDAFRDQYIQALALAQSAVARNEHLLATGGWRLMSNLEQMRAQSQAMRGGVNPFGFIASYVPLQTYDELFKVTRDTFLRDAEQDEDVARAAQRQFDQDAKLLKDELQSLRLTYDTRLLELCGQQADYSLNCTGGLMEQNRLTMIAALNRIRLADQRVWNSVKAIEIEQQRVQQVIYVTELNGQRIAAIERAKGIASAYRVTEAEVVVHSNTTTWGGGIEVNVGSIVSGAATGAAAGPVGAVVGGLVGLLSGVSGGIDYRHSKSETKSITKVWDPTEEELGYLNGLREVQQAATQVRIEAANSEAVIRNLFLEQAELLIQVDIEIDEYNRLSAEHRSLVQQYHNIINLRHLAQENLIDSYLTNPAYRIMRDSLTIEAARSQSLAAQFAYLTAKALEYEFLSPVPFINDIFKARTADDIDNFINRLEQHRLALGAPGDLNRFPYRISIAKDILGLTDQYLDPANKLNPTERARLRFQRFQAFLQQYRVLDQSGTLTAVEFPFTTSLLDRRIFSPNIWNNRIAGVSLPAGVPGVQGVSINVVTRQTGNIGTPEVALTHGGTATYRTIENKFVSYTPANARLAGYITPPGFNGKTKTAVIVSNVNGERGTPTSALFNLSVAASSWALRIDLTSPYNRNVDIRQIEDIEMWMDTTAIALPRLAQEARADAMRLQAAFNTP